MRLRSAASPRRSRRFSIGSPSQAALAVGGIFLAVMLALVVFLVAQVDRDPPPPARTTVVVPTTVPRPVPLPIVDVTPTSGRAVTTTTTRATTTTAPATTVPPTTTTTSPPTTTTRPCLVAVLGRCLP